MPYVKDDFLTQTDSGLPIYREFLCNCRRYSATSIRNVDCIVLHYTGNYKDTARNNARWFSEDSSTISSAHFFVDENDIYQSVKLHDTAWHAGNDEVSRRSFGIEMCCSGDYKVSEATKKKAAQLVVTLMKKYGIGINGVIRHYDASRKECPKQMAGDNNAEWIEYKAYIKQLLDGSVVDDPQDKKQNYRAQYEVTSLSYLRVGPGIARRAVKRTNKGTVVNCYGKYSLSSKGKVWLYVDAYVNGTKYTGYIRKSKLKMITRL